MIKINVQFVLIYSFIAQLHRLCFYQLSLAFLIGASSFVFLLPFTLQPLPKVNWKKRLDHRVVESDSPSEDPHYGLAVFMVMLVACGALLVRGTSQGRKTVLKPLRRRHTP